MADALDIMATFIVQRLQASAAITSAVGTRIYQDVAPQDATLPYIIFQSTDPSDLRAVGAIRVATNDEWLVKAVAQTASYGGILATLADAIDAQLHGSDGVHGVVAGGTVLHSYRSKPFRMAEVDNGIQYRYKGGFYRLMAQVQS